MAEIIDTRSSDGLFVVLGSALTLPNSNTTSSSFPPLQGSLRWNGTAVQYYNGTVWNSIGGVSSITVRDSVTTLTNVTKITIVNGTVTGTSNDCTITL